MVFLLTTQTIWNLRLSRMGVPIKGVSLAAKCRKLTARLFPIYNNLFTIADIILVLQILALFGPISLSHSNAYISHSNTWISHSILLFLVPLCMLSSQKIGEQLQDLFASILTFIQKVLFNVKLEAPEKIIIGLIKKKVIKKCSVCVKNGTSSVISLSGLHKLGK